MLASWGFPEAFCEAILLHCDSTQASGESASLAAATELGNRIANQIEEGWPDDISELEEALVESAQRLGIDSDRLTDVASEAAASFQALSKLS